MFTLTVVFRGILENQKLFETPLAVLLFIKHHGHYTHCYNHLYMDVTDWLGDTIIKYDEEVVAKFDNDELLIEVIYHSKCITEADMFENIL